MSWASQRQTTRPEDVAYSLLGIFGINMPLLYGEGTKAFIRLQEEIVKESDDQSIFAWVSEDNNYWDSTDEYLFPGSTQWLRKRIQGLFARSPAEFASSGNIVPLSTWETGEPYTMTNKGLRLSIPLVPSPLYPNEYLGVLACGYEGSQKSPLGISLVKVGGTEERSAQYARIAPARLQLITADRLCDMPSPVPIYMRKHLGDARTNDNEGVAFRIDSLLREFSVVEVWPETLWASEPEPSLDKLIWLAGRETVDSFGSGIVLLFECDPRYRRSPSEEIRQFVLILGFRRKRVWYAIEERKPMKTLYDHWAQAKQASEKESVVCFECYEYTILIQMQQTKIINTSIYTIRLNHQNLHDNNEVIKLTKRKGVFGRLKGLHERSSPTSCPPVRSWDQKAHRSLVRLRGRRIQPETADLEDWDSFD